MDKPAASIQEEEDERILNELHKAADAVGAAEYSGKTVRFTCPKCQHVFLPNAKERQSRVGRSSRSKGANFERAVAKKMQKWWGNGSVWKRTPMSGGSVLKEGFDLAGDLACNAKDMPFHFELKNSPTKFAGLSQLLTAEKCAVWEWWKQAQEDCPQHRTPILVFNRPDEPTYCMTYNNIMLLHCRIRFLVFGEYSIFTLDDLLKSDPNMWRKT